MLGKAISRRGVCALGALMALVAMAVSVSDSPADSISKLEKSVENSSALSNRITVDFQETPLSDVLAFMRDFTGRDFKITAYRDEEWEYVPINLVASGISVERLFELVFDQLGRPVRWNDGESFSIIPTDDRAHIFWSYSNREMRRYPVKDLLEVPGREGEFAADLQLLLQRFVAPDSWSASGKGAGSIAYDPESKTFAVSQSFLVHREISEFLAGLRESRKQSNRAIYQAYGVSLGEHQRNPKYRSSINKEAATKYGPVLLGDGPVNDFLEGQLDVPVKFEFSETPLREVLSDVASKMRINVAINLRRFEGKAINLQTPVTYKSEAETTLRTALTAMLRPLNLAFGVDDGVIEIVPADSADKLMTTRMYPVANLIADLGHSDVEAGDWMVRHFRKLTKDQTVWDDMGGPAAIAFDPVTYSLIVRQDFADQVKLQEALRHQSSHLNAQRWTDKNEK